MQRGAEVWKEKYCYVGHTDKVPLIVHKKNTLNYVGHTDTWLAFLDWDLDASTNFCVRVNLEHLL